MVLSQSGNYKLSIALKKDSVQCLIVKTDQLYIPSIRGEDYNLHTTYNEQLLIKTILLMIREQSLKRIHVPNPSSPSVSDCCTSKNKEESELMG